MTIRIHLTAVVASLLMATSAWAQPAPPMVDAEVRKVDKDLGRLTLRHGPIPQLDMAAMTMVFRVADPKLLDGLKPGDKLRFSAENRNGALTVTAIAAAP